MGSEILKISDEVDIDGSGEIDEGEFLMCLRKVHEYEMSSTRRVFGQMDVDCSGGIDPKELDNVLKSLGYQYPSREAIAEVYDELGLCDSDDLSLSQFWCFLHAYRFREGFTAKVAREFEEA